MANEGNKNALGNNGGAPPIFESAEDMYNKALEYFEDIRSGKKVKATMAGLAFHLGFESRQSMYDYEKKAEFSYIVKRLRLFVESCYENQLYTFTATGAIFALKNMGWKDKVETEVTSTSKTDIDYTNLTNEELEVIERVLAKSSKGGEV